MSEHSYHPDSHTHGLADDCERCAEHASHPLRSLDADNLRQLRFRIRDGLPARSDNERLAMERLKAHDEETTP